MKKLMMMVAGLAVLAANAGTSDQYFYWNVESAANEFSYAKLAYSLSGGDGGYFTVGDKGATAVAAATGGKTTERVFSNFGATDWSDYAFKVETYNASGNLVGLSASLGFDDISGYLYSYDSMMSAGTSGVDAKGIAVGAVPEPTSALLLLLGVAGLALKRKRVGGLRTARPTVMFVALLAAGLCFGAANDTLISFSTQGPDTYGDGTTVLDGECYALVWTKTGAAFGGFNADGTLVSANDRLVVVASLASGGCCPATLFEIDAADAALYADGTFGLYLLDTRIRGANGRVKLGGAGALAGAAGAQGAPRSVNAAARAAGGSRTLSGGAVAMAEVGVYSKIDEPEIKAMRVDGAKIELTVSGMNPVAEYFVVQGATPGKVAARMKTAVEGDKLVVDKPAGGAMFFKVLGARAVK